MYELGQNYLDTQDTEYKITNDHVKNVKVSDKVFEMMIDEGLLRKTDDGYVFVGKYQDLPQKKKKKPRLH